MLSLRTDKLALSTRLRSYQRSGQSTGVVSENQKIRWAAGSFAMIGELFLALPAFQTSLDKSVDPSDATTRYFNQHTKNLAVVAEAFFHLQSWGLGEAFEDENRHHSLTKEASLL